MSKKLLTTEDLKDIAISDLSYEKICAHYKIGKNTVAKIKKAAGTQSGSRNANSKRLTNEQRQYVIDSKLDGATLSKEMGISIPAISSIRIKAGVAAGRGINIRLSLSPEQKKEVAFCTLSRVETCKRFSISAFMYHKIKKEFGTAIGRGNGIRTTGFKLTDQQKSEIVESNLPYDEIGLKYEIHESTVGKIKRAAGIVKKRGNHNKPRTAWTDQMITRLKDVTISGRKLSVELGISPDIVSRKRKELGVNYDEWKKDNPAPRTKRAYTPRPKKITVNSRGKKELPVKLIVTKKKSESAPMAKTQFEIQSERMEKARLTAEKHKEKESLELATTHKFITRIGRFGIRETVKVKRELHEIKTQ